MPEHEQFEELCALAAAGALRHQELERLGEHLRDCYPCRCLFSEMSDIHAQWLPTARNPEGESNPIAEAALRTRILKRASQSGTHISRRAHRSPENPIATSIWRPNYAWLAATAVLAVVAWSSVGVMRLHPATKISVPEKTAVAAPPTGALMPVQDNDVSRQREMQLENTIQVLQSRSVVLESALREQQQKVDILRGTNSASEQAIASLTKELDDMRSRRAALDAELTQIKSSKTVSDTVAIEQQAEIERLNQRLSDQSAMLDREQQMLASGRSIRDLIAARNVHIIDVYDTDSHGKSSAAFGRVFYTEGKSLIFYAYDLGNKHREAGEISFYVWGKQDGAPQNVRKLGALIQDDNLQRRWVFTLSDPKVLAEIDSVFVTLEPGNQAEKQPHGKRFLSAYLGSPANHP